MQFLIDTATETPRTLMMATRLLTQLAAMMVENEQPDINGTSDPIKLFEHTHGAYQAATEAASKRPTPPPIGPAPHAPGAPVPLPAGNQPPAPVVHPERHPDAPNPGTPPEHADPAAVFRGPSIGGVTAAVIVPAGTSADPPPPAPAGNVSLGGAAGTQTPVAAVPAAPATPQERDGDNIPWDARIHSESKKLNGDGTWRYRRNLDPAVKAQVYAELKATYGVQVSLPQSPVSVAGGVPLPPATPAVSGAPAAPNPVPATQQPPSGGGGVPEPPQVSLPNNVVPIGGPAAVPLPPSADVGVSNPAQPPVVSNFRELMTKVNVALAGGRLTQEQLTSACRSAGVADGSVSGLATQPMLVPVVDAVLNQYLSGAAA